MTELERLNLALKTAFLRIGIAKKKDMANYLEYDVSYISSILTGNLALSSNFLDKIQRMLNVNSNWILTGKGEMLLKDDNININNNNNIKSNNINSDDVLKKMAEVFENQLKVKDEQIDRLLRIIENK